jgi:hypothetical protein
VRYSLTIDTPVPLRVLIIWRDHRNLARLQQGAAKRLGRRP